MRYLTALSIVLISLFGPFVNCALADWVLYNKETGYVEAVSVEPWDAIAKHEGQEEVADGYNARANNAVYDKNLRRVRPGTKEEQQAAALASGEIADEV